MKYLISLSIYLLFATPAFAQFDFFNKPPTIDKIKDFTTFENSGAQKIVLTGIGPGRGESNQTVTIKAFSNNLNLINHPKIEYDQSTTAVLIFTAKTNNSGKATITVELDDGQNWNNTTETSFDIIVKPINSPPSFKLSTNVVNVDEGKGKVKIKKFATQIEDGDPDKKQNLAFIITLKKSDNSLTFKSSPKIDVRNGDLSFEANINSFGKATFSVILKDDGGTENGGNDTSTSSDFTISVKNINDPPTLADINPVTLNEDPGEKSVGLKGISSGANESQKLTIKAVSDNPNLITNIKIAYTQGKTTATLKFTPKLNLFGSAVITVTVNDGQSKDNIISKELSVTVNPVADTPKVTNAIVKNGKQTTSGLVISRNTADGDEVTHFKITSIANGKLYFNDGKTQIVNNKFITIKQGNTGLKFTPKTGPPVNGSFKIQAATGAKDSNLGGGIITAKITIDNSPPVITSNPVVTGEVAKLYTYNIKATDPNALDKLTFSFVIPNAIKPWLKSTDNKNGTAKIFGTPPSGTDGLYKISIKVKDQLGKSAQQTYNLRVNKKNQKPVLTPLSFNIQEDDSVFFSFEDFDAHYTDPEGDAMKFIKIASLPQYGTLRLDSMTLNQNDLVEIEKIDQFKYIPDPNYFGLDIFDWNASDGNNFAQVPKRVSVTIASVNDLPEIRDFELNPFVFEFGDIGVSLTDSGRVIDVDGDKLEMVTVSIAENYINGEDSLYFQYVNGLTYDWADSAGILTIRGIEPPSVYQEAIRSLQYINLNRLSPTGSYRKIDIVLHDPDTFSLPYSRLINFENTFVDLDIPNGFTPNDDGVNDTWNIKNLDRYEDFHIAVFSRTGQEIYKSDNYYLNEWDGSYNGEPVPTGTYYYLITLNKFQKVFKGALFVMK